MSFFLIFNVVGTGVGVVLAELPFTVVPFSSGDFFDCEVEVEVAVGFSVLGFGDAAGLGLSTFFGLALLVDTVTVVFGLAGSALAVSSDFVLSTFFGLGLPVATVSIGFNESK